MNTASMYVINAILVLMVIRQIREHPLDLRSLAVPVLAVGAAAALFLRSVPVAGNDVVLELACVAAGATMGALAGLATKLRRDPASLDPASLDPAAPPKAAPPKAAPPKAGRALGRAGWLAASLWIAGVGARMAFAFADTHGAGPAITRFSMAHQIIGKPAWVAALIMMALADVLTRLVIIYVRGHRLTAAAPVRPATPVGAGA